MSPRWRRSGSFPWKPPRARPGTSFSPGPRARPAAARWCWPTTRMTRPRRSSSICCAAAARPALPGCGPATVREIGGVTLEILRPLLGVWRAELEEYARRNGVRHREDASNASPGSHAESPAPHHSAVAFAGVRPRCAPQPLARGGDPRRAAGMARASAAAAAAAELSVAALRALPEAAAAPCVIQRWLRRAAVPQISFELVEDIRVSASGRRGSGEGQSARRAASPAAGRESVIHRAAERRASAQALPNSAPSRLELAPHAAFSCASEQVLALVVSGAGPLPGGGGALAALLKRRAGVRLGLSYQLLGLALALYIPLWLLGWNIGQPPLDLRRGIGAVGGAARRAVRPRPAPPLPVGVLFRRAARHRHPEIPPANPGQPPLLPRPPGRGLRGSTAFRLPASSLPPPYWSALSAGPCRTCWGM